MTDHDGQALAKGSSSFALAARLFGRTLREDVAGLYAWCRHCDDEIDGQDHGQGAVLLTDADRQARLARIRRLTRDALAGLPMDDPAFAAFQRVAKRHALPPEWPLGLIDGFAMDVDRREYRQLDEMLDYCWGVAGVVGVMMAAMMGVRDPFVLARAQDLGLAFQITNICRDVAEDARQGRLYLPGSLRARRGLPDEPAALLDPAHRDAAFAVVQDLLALAEAYYRSSRAGLRSLPFRGALAVAAARGIYREIGRRILREGPPALSRRMRVPKPVMAWLMLRGVAVACWSRVERATPMPARPPLWSRLPA